MNNIKVIARLGIIIVIGYVVFIFFAIPLRDKSIVMEFKDHVLTSDIDGLEAFLSSKQYNYNKLILKYIPEWSPFEYIAERNEVQKFNRLLKYGISPQFINLQDEEIIYPNPDIIKRPKMLQSLLDYGLEINPSTETHKRKIIIPPLYVAIRNLFVGIGKYGKYKDIQNRGYYKSILSLQSWQNYYNERNAEDIAILKSINLLLSNNANVNRGIISDTRKMTPLMEACWKGRVDIIDLLLNLGADPYIDDNGIFALDICYMTNGFVSEEERQKAINLLVERMQK